MSAHPALPVHQDLFYGGSWHPPMNGEYQETINPCNGETISQVAEAGVQDVDQAVSAAEVAFRTWRSTPPEVRAACLLKAADIILDHAEDFAYIDALNTGNPFTAMLNDAKIAAESLRYFAGLIPMLKGDTIPQTNDTFHFTIHEPLGVVARIVAFNHPMMFAAGRIAAPLAAGNTVVVKPPDQAPLSCLRLAELLGSVFPAGVVNILPGGKECGQALSVHPKVKMVTLIGSVATGKAIQQSIARHLKPSLMELGGKNALIALPDADPEKLVKGISQGMNFTWAGQSCGSTSRVFLHETLYDRILDKVVETVRRDFQPGISTDRSTTMGPVISKAAQDRVLGYIESAKNEGARLVLGGKKPDGVPGIQNGFFIEPTIFADVKSDMRIAREEIFGPVLSVFKWRDFEEVMEQVNSTPYGLTAAVFTESITTAYKVVRRIEAGFVWVNTVGRHYSGVPFGGVKESGIGRDECLGELLAFTQTKSVNFGLS